MENNPINTTDTWTKEKLGNWLIDNIAAELNLKADEIPLDQPFSVYGFDSASALGLSGELQELLQVKLDPTIVFEFPTISTLSEYLAELVNGK